MICPECGEQMWNYGPGQMRCNNDHVFATVHIKGVQERVVRIDRPTMKERFMDYAAGVVTGGALTAAVVVLVEKL